MDHVTSTLSTPLVLTVPGLDGSGPAHWQSIWERESEECGRADLGNWARPNRTHWVSKLNLAIRSAGRPVILAAHSLGCHAVAAWAAMERPDFGYPVVGALLVAPPELDLAPLDERLEPFAPASRAPLPFPSILVASRDDPYIQYHRARRLAQFWGSRFADAGAVGHINAASGLGSWGFGRFLLARLHGAGRKDRHGTAASVWPMESASVDLSA
ncbi:MULTISPECIES: RBBP9/YdeN family alpha/beta hydrolase [unclassified Sphingobium]|uniref:RBBP9/YdeN family alpha/beta hydrolase n=1 Tax=unclassified Sphingobium TaxID=2611147 RepID=UPI0022246067|nr:MULTISPECIES: alpha/beta hydrolase [unclassified Sphingobium]MCW2394991.1 putative alpha/beta hydrolase family esterase [Sphingobium sp. B8D3B]MCW2418505.1 putative alpha/beta hydrolase family esterase [Sphingobium sp. B8D3C]